MSYPPARGTGRPRPARPRPGRPRRASRRVALWTAAGAAGLLVIGGVAGTAAGAFGDGADGAPTASGSSFSPSAAPTAPVADAPRTAPSRAPQPKHRKARASHKPAPRATHRRPATKAPTKAPAKPKAPAAPAGGTAGRYASQVVALVNAERAKHGCGALTVNGKLARAAQGHSADMHARNFFDHTNPDGKDPGDRITAAGYRWSSYGENIAKGQATPASVMDAWMNSSGHRANILNCGFKEIGVGVVLSGGPYWTQDFGTSR